MQEDATSVKAIVTLYSRAMEALAFACLVGIVIMTATQVFSRYVLGMSFFWPEEAARILLIFITFLVAGISFERGEMIGVTAVRDLFGRRFALVVAILGHLLILVLLAVLVRYGWAFAQRNAVQHAAALRVSMFWVYLVIPVGMSLLACHVVVSMIRRILELRARPGAGR